MALLRERYGLEVPLEALVTLVVTFNEGIILERLSAAERTAFLLHDVFGLTFEDVAGVVGRSPAAVRQLASRARRHVEDGRPRFPPTQAEQRELVAAFTAAAYDGDIEGLVATLDPDVVWRSDGGGKATALRRVERGAERESGDVQDTGAAELRRMVRRRELAVAYLYRFLLSRIDQPVLKDLAFPGLVGVLPDIGRMDPNDWGLGFELRDAKVPHWTGSRNSPRTFGHFGGAGTFLWVDPVAGLATAVLTDTDFGPWAIDAWPALGFGFVEAGMDISVLPVPSAGGSRSR